MEDKDKRADPVPGGRTDKKPDVSRQTFTPQPGAPERGDRPGQPPVLRGSPKSSERTLGGMVEADTRLDETSLHEQPEAEPERVEHTAGPEDPEDPPVASSEQMIGNKRVDTATEHAGEPADFKHAMHKTDHDNQKWLRPQDEADEGDR